MKTINTKENQITLHTKDTIIEEDIVVNFEGGSSGTDTSDATATSSDMLLGKTAYVKDEKVTGTIPTWDGSVENGVVVEENYLLSYAKKILDNDTEDYPAKAIFIMQEDWNDVISDSGNAFKFSDEPENLYADPSATNKNYYYSDKKVRGWDESKYESYSDGGATIKFKWFIAYYKDTNFRCNINYIISYSLLVYIKDADYVDEQQFLYETGTGTQKNILLEQIVANKPLKLKQEMSLAGKGTWAGGNVRALKTLPEFDTSEIPFSQFSLYLNGAIRSIKAKDNVLRTKAVNFRECWRLVELPEIDLVGGQLDGGFYSCINLKEIKFRNTESNTNGSNAFNDCYKLETIKGLDCINVTSFSSYFFSNCKSLKNLEIKNIKASLQIAKGTYWGHLLTVESLINTCKELIKTGSTLTLTMGTTNLNKLANVYVKFTDPSITEIVEGEKGDVVVCDSTDEGAMLITDYTTMKGWTLA